MIVYKDAFGLPPETIGIGSVATPPAFRRNGYASQLIRDFLAMKPLEAVRAVFLFSEVKPEFYGKLGFVALPPELQKYPKSLCMVRCDPDYLDAIRSGLVEPPLYF
jgi:predicted acetyltransferase